MSEASSNDKRIAELVEEAAGAGAATKKKLRYRQAMQVVGFTADKINSAAIDKRVIRRSKALLTPPSGDTVSTPVAPVAIVIVAPHQSAISSVTNGSANGFSRV
jgi:hypothetical protein